MLLYIHRGKLLQPFSPHSIDQQVSACYHNFLTVIQSYHSKVTSNDALHTEKMDGTVLFYVFRITFPGSLLQ